ncbi:MAG: hypothetical protein ACK4E7_16455 [Permianibacter sp.]
MSPTLAEIVALSDELKRLATVQDWSGMVSIGHTRQEKLEAYFAATPLPDDGALVREVLTAIQQTDAVLLREAGSQRQRLLQDAVDLRQRWQMSNTYQRVQNLQT